MKNLLKKSKHQELLKLMGDAAELVEELEKEKKDLNMRCTSLEIDVTQLRREILKLKGENKSLAARNTKLQQDLNEKRLEVAISSRQAQKLAFENAGLHAYIEKHKQEVSKVG